MDRDERAVWAPRIQSARVAAGLGLEELAKMAGTNRRTLSDYERGVTVAQESIIDRLIEVLGLLGNSPEWDKDVEILAPAILSLIQLIQAERRPSAVRSSVEALVAFLKTPHVVDEPGDVID